MMKPVMDCALNAFFRGLPDDMSIFVDTRNPKDLSEALEYALHIEERLNYAEKSRAVASSYHVSRKDTEPERPRSPSPYSKLMNPILKGEQKPVIWNPKTVSFASPHAGIPNGNYRQNDSPYSPPFYGKAPPFTGQPPVYPGQQPPYMPYTVPYPYAPNWTNYPMDPSPWKNSGKPSSISNSPGPSRDLNSTQTPGTDATLGRNYQKRPPSNNFPQNSIGLYE